MISDYMGYEEEAVEKGRSGMFPSYDVWGIVVPASENTEKGTVRVRVKSMKDNRDIFDSVPVLTNYGGDAYGSFFLPEEGDTVRLSFLGGDMRHPVVTGSRFPASSRYVKELFQKENLKKGLATKSGSSFLISEEKGKEKIELSGPEKLKWELDEGEQETFLGDKERKNQVCISKKKGQASLKAEEEICLECGKSSLVLQKDGTIRLKCRKLTLDADTVEIKGNKKVLVKGQELSMEGTAGVAVTGKGNIKLDSKGAVKLSGAMLHLN